MHHILKDDGFSCSTNHWDWAIASDVYWWLFHRSFVKSNRAISWKISEYWNLSATWKHWGAHGPRNVGIVNARGEYSVFLDADDWYDLNALKYLSDLLDDSHDDFAVSGLIQSTDGHLMLKVSHIMWMGHLKSVYPRIASWILWLVRTASYHVKNFTDTQ